MEVSNTTIAAIAAVSVAAGGAGVYIFSGSTPPLAPAAIELADVSLDPAVQAAERPGAIVRYEAAPSAPIARPTAVVERRAAPARPAAPRIARVQRTETAPQPAAPVDTRFSVDAAEPVAPADDNLPEAEATAAAEPPAQFVELVIPEDSVLGLQVETSLTSETARVEEEVVARVTRDVRVNDRVAIPSGARALGTVTLVERGGRMRERARLGVRFTSVVLADGTRIPLETDTVYREGSSPGGESTAKIGGGAIGGAIVGGILGGARGAVIGGSVGAGAGTAAVLAGGRNPATLPSGTAITVRLTGPATVVVEN